MFLTTRICICGVGRRGGGERQGEGTRGAPRGARRVVAIPHNVGTLGDGGDPTQ